MVEVADEGRWGGQTSASAQVLSRKYDDVASSFRVEQQLRSTVARKCQRKLTDVFPGRKCVGKLAFLAPFGRGNSGSMCGDSIFWAPNDINVIFYLGA